MSRLALSGRFVLSKDPAFRPLDSHERAETLSDDMIFESSFGSKKEYSHGRVIKEIPCDRNQLDRKDEILYIPKGVIKQG